MVLQKDITIQVGEGGRVVLIRAPFYDFELRVEKYAFTKNQNQIHAYGCR